MSLKGPALEIRHFAAGFFDNQHACRRVPGIEIELPEAVEASAGHTAQVERRRTRPPHAVRAQSDLMIEVNVRILVPLVAGKAGGHQAFGQVRDLRHLDCVADSVRAASLLGREQLVARGIVNHAGNSPVLVLQSQRNAEHRKSVRKVGGAIERIDIPAIVAAGIDQALLFAENIVSWASVP